jgi:superoxide dismutase, Cu-Zn family
MKIFSSFVGLLFVLTCAGVASATAATKPVIVDIKNGQGQSVGTATLSEAPHGVKIKLDIKSLPPGEHSLHIHQFAKCEGPDFKSAGPHFNPSGAGHGDHADHGGLPAGDIPDFSLIVAPDGTAHATVVAPNVTVGTDDHSVFSNGGTAMVIHAVASGASSASSTAPPRIACGVITKPE